MISNNWSSFESLTDNPQYSFELLCYILFCKEFKQDNGIFRFKNQTGIENEPINYNNEIIGYQAKYYNKTLSNYTKDFENMILNTKKNYPNLTKLIVYTNQEWAQSKKNIPPKDNLNTLAKNNGIEIIWNCKSFFEKKAYDEDCKYIFNCFFESNYNKNIQYLENMNDRYINNFLINKEKKYLNLNNDLYLEEINQSENSIIIYGDFGTGKTTLIEEFYNKIKMNHLFFYIPKTSIDIWINNEEIFLFYNEKNKILVIDDCNNLIEEKIIIFIEKMLEKGWKCILIFKNIDNEKIKKLSFNKQFDLIKLSDLTELDVKKELLKNNIPMVKDNNLLDLIKKPIMLNSYISNIDYFNKNKIENYYIPFLNILISDDIDKKNILIKIAEQKYLLMPIIENNKIKELINDNIIVNNSGCLNFKNIYYQNLVSLDMINRAFIMSDHNYILFIEKVKNNRLLSNLFEWIKEKNDFSNIKKEHIKSLLDIYNSNIEIKNQIYKGLVKSNDNFVIDILNSLDIDFDFLLHKMHQYCFVLDFNYLRNYFRPIDKNYIVYRPCGDIFIKIFDYIIKKNIDLTENIAIILRKWISFYYEEDKNNVKKIARYCLYKYRKCKTINLKINKEILIIISYGSYTIKRQLKLFMKQLANYKQNNDERFYLYEDFYSFLYNDNPFNILIKKSLPLTWLKFMKFVYLNFNNNSLYGIDLYFDTKNLDIDFINNKRYNIFYKKIFRKEMEFILEKIYDYYTKNQQNIKYVNILLHNREIIQIYSDDMWCKCWKDNELDIIFIYINKFKQTLIEYIEIGKLTNYEIYDLLCRILMKTRFVFISSILLEIAICFNQLDFIRLFYVDKNFFIGEREKIKLNYYLPKKDKNLLDFFENDVKNNIGIAIKNRTKYLLEDKKNDLFWTKYLLDMKLNIAEQPAYIQYLSYKESEKLKKIKYYNKNEPTSHKYKNIKVSLYNKNKAYSLWYDLYMIINTRSQYLNLKEKINIIRLIVKLEKKFAFFNIDPIDLIYKEILIIYSIELLDINVVFKNILLRQTIIKNKEKYIKKIIKYGFEKQINNDVYYHLLYNFFDICITDSFILNKLKYNFYYIDNAITVNILMKLLNVLNYQNMDEIIDGIPCKVFCSLIKKIIKNQNVSYFKLVVKKLLKYKLDSDINYIIECFYCEEINKKILINILFRLNKIWYFNDNYFKLLVSKIDLKIIDSQTSYLVFIDFLKQLELNKIDINISSITKTLVENFLTDYIIDNEPNISIEDKISILSFLEKYQFLRIAGISMILENDVRNNL